MAPWLGLFVWSGASAAAIGFSRIPAITDFGTSRYYSLGALCLLATVVIMATALATARPARWLVPAEAVLVAGNALLAGNAGVTRDDQNRPRQELLTVALRLDVEQNSLRWIMYERMPHLSPLLEAIGHYPFDDDFTYGCGRIDTRLEPTEVARSLPATVTAHVTHRNSPSVPLAESFRGQISVEPDCVIITDRARNVFGAGIWIPNPRLPEGNPNRVIEALAPAGSSQYLVFVRLPGLAEFYPAPDKTETRN